METAKAPQLDEVIQPLHRWILVRKDDDKTTSKGGIILPPGSEKVVLTARVLKLGTGLVADSGGPHPDCQLKQYDKVIVNPCRSIQPDLENETLYLVLYEDVIALVSKAKGTGESLPN